MHIVNIKNKSLIPALLFAGLMTTGCTMVTDDLDPCPALLRIKFEYDYNIKWADAFRHEVKSVNVWAFTPDGRLAWNGEASGETLASSSFYLDTPLTEGEYDFVTWCGLKDNNGFDLATYTPTTKEELEVTLRTVEKDGRNVSDIRLPGLYHGYVSDFKYEVDPNNPTVKTVVFSLMKDTKDIRVMLQHLDGSPIENRDFSVSITYGDGEYAWDNSLLPSPVISYEPWEVRYGVITTPDDEPGAGNGSRSLLTRDDGTISSVATLLFDLSTGRLMADDENKAILTIHRNWDNRDIVRIPLINYLLLVKGHYGDISDQEYLDRQDDYSIVFFIDKNSNWASAAGIFINSWAVVPPQDLPL